MRQATLALRTIAPGSPSSQLIGVSKQSCRAATTANINLTVGGLLAIDTYQTVLNDRILVKEQLDPTKNGIWLAKTNAWVRAADFDSSDEIKAGTNVWITDGDVNADKMFILDIYGEITLGTTALQWTGWPPETGVSGVYSAGQGLNLAGNTFSIPNSGVTGAMIAANLKDPVAATAGLRTLGTSAQQAMAGNDQRLSDAQAAIGTLADAISGVSTAVGSRVQVGGDIGGTPSTPTVTGIHFTVPIAKGGTGSTTQNFLDVTTAQSAAGIKTFSDYIILPNAPTADTHGANKLYVDQKVAAGGGGGGSAYKQHFDIRDYGAKCDGITDDTAAVQSAINAAKASTTPGIFFQNSSGTWQGGSTANGGGLVYFPPAVTVVTNIVLEHRVGICGSGWGSIIKQKASSTGPLVTNRRDGTVHAKYCTIRDISLFGNRTQQSSSTCHGIVLRGDNYNNTQGYNNYQSPLDEDYDENHSVINVYIWNVKGDGLRLEGSGENRIIGVKILRADGIGFYTFQDNFISNLTVGWAGRMGVWVDGDDCRLTVVKCWYSGQVINSDGQGFWITADSGTLASCSAQDNTAQGFLWDNAFGWDCSALMADSNSKGNSGTYAGFDVYNSSFCKITGTARNRYNPAATPGVQQHCIRVRGSNTIVADMISATGVWGTVNSLQSGSSTTNCFVKVNGASV